MKTRLLILFLCAAALRVDASHWHGYRYEFDCFKLRAEQLMGSIGPEQPELYVTAAQLNEYVMRLQQEGKLENKPVVYDINVSDYDRRRWLVEVYRTRSEYRININPRHAQLFEMHFSQKELKRIIDYLASEDFEPFYCDTTQQRFELCRELLFAKIDALLPPAASVQGDTCTLFSEGDWAVRSVEGTSRIFYGDQQAGQTQRFLVARPVVMNRRLIVLHGRIDWWYDDDYVLHIGNEGIYYSVYDKGRHIRTRRIGSAINTDYESGDGDFFNLTSRIEPYLQWFNIYDHAGRATYSYSYAQNRIYRVQ